MSEAILLEVSDLGRDYDRGRVRALHDVCSSDLASARSVARRWR